MPKLDIRSSFPPFLIPLALLAGSAAACGGGDENAPEDARIALPAAPQNGFQMVLPEMRWEAATDNQLCWFTTLPGDEDVWVQSIQAFQGAGGHHLIVFSTSEDVADGTVEDCSDARRMKFWRLIFTPISSEGAFTVPEGYAMKLPAHTKLVFQVHYINARTKPMLVRDAINFTRATKTENIVRVAPFSTGITDFVIPAHSQKSVTYECPIDQDMNAFTGFGHMHERGTSILVRAGDPAAMDEVYRVDTWTANYRDRPPLLERSFADPYVFHKGTVIRTTCSWSSDEDQDIGFPQEMCASAFWVYPAMDAVTCSGVTLP